MTIKTIKIKNILSFDFLELKKINSVNAVIGKNNTGKSNLLKAIKFFYSQLESKRVLPPELNSNYSTFGEIEIEYDLTRIRRIVQSKNSNVFFKHIYTSMFFDDFWQENTSSYGDSLKLKLIIHSNGKIEWSEKNKDILKIINYLYPFFDIDARHIDLHNWDNLWILISKIKSFKVAQVKSNEISEAIDSLLCNESLEFVRFIEKIETEIKIKKYTPREKLISLIKASLPGDSFYSSGDSQMIQSDGTNSFNYIDIALKLLIIITRREYISPFIYIDEPEVGLHPKKSELLINNLYDIVSTSQISTNNKKINTPLPTIFFATHSPNIIKEIIKNFKENQTIFYFNKNVKNNTTNNILNSKYDQLKFINKFSDNEARLFFSNYILFVEGATELELFGNANLKTLFPILRDIDIYQNNDNTLTEAINPSSTHAAIPFLYIYDTDKAFTFKNNYLYLNKTSSTVNLHESELYKEVEYYSKGYSNDYKKRLSQLNKVLSFIKIPFNVDLTHVFMRNRRAFNTMREIIQEYLLDKRVILLDDTIEGVLICNESKEIFYKWLFERRQVDIYPLVKKIRTYKYITEEHLVCYLRFMFNGKLDTQLSKKKNIFLKKQIAKKYNIKEEQKTSGWVSDFLNFAINDLKSKNMEKNELVSDFIRHFPQIHNIIKRINLR